MKLVRLVPCFLVLVVACLADAQPTPRAYLFATAAASTPPAGPPYPIVVDVTVENRGQADSMPANLELVTKPSVTSDNKPKRDVLTMWDPVSQSQPIGALKPGVKKVLHFTTQYECNAAFKNRTGSFKATNIAPAGADVTVTMITTMKEPSAK